MCKLWGWRKEFYCEFRWDELAQITRIKRITVLPRMARICTDVRVRRDINNGLNGLNGFLLLGIFNNGLNRLNGFYSSGGILPPPRPSYIRAIRAIRGRNILDVRGRPQNTLNTRKTIAERWTNTNYANKANNSSPTDGGWTQMLGCAEMNNGLNGLQDACSKESD